MFDSHAYFGLPSPYTGQLLNSYGGYLRFRLSPVPNADRAPEVIIQVQSPPGNEPADRTARR